MIEGFAFCASWVVWCLRRVKAERERSARKLVGEDDNERRAKEKKRGARKTNQECKHKQMHSLAGLLALC